MKTARIVILGLLVTALVAGLAMYYLQVYAFYRVLSAEDVGQVRLVSLVSGQPEPILAEDLAAIDADSSPLRFRACFRTPVSLATLTETYRIAEGAVPRIGPGWFDCFDASAIGAALESGQAVAFLSEPEIHYGIDRIVAVLPDGRAFAWNDINACGAVVFDGNPAPEGCPTPPEGAY